MRAVSLNSFSFVLVYGVRDRYTEAGSRNSQATSNGTGGSRKNGSLEPIDRMIAYDSGNWWQCCLTPVKLTQIVSI